MIVKLLTEHHLEFLSLKGGCRGSSESTLVKMSKCWKSHAAAHFQCKFSVNTLWGLKEIDEVMPTSDSICEIGFYRNVVKRRLMLFK